MTTMTHQPTQSGLHINRSAAIIAISALLIVGALGAFVAAFSGDAALVITLGLVVAVVAPIVAFSGVFEKVSR